MPYSVYPELEFDVPIGTGEMGDARRLLRSLHRPHARDAGELQASSASASRRSRDGPVIAKVPRNFKPPAGRRLRADRERARRHGLVRRVRRHGASRIAARSARARSRAISIVPKLVSRNLMIADLIAVIASLDLVAPEIDR